MSYFNLELESDQAPIGMRHKLNQRYRGSRLFEMRAPDANGVMLVWAIDEQEAREHLINAFFDLIFRSCGPGVSAHNPKCPFCGYRTQRRGRTPDGKRRWFCLRDSCGRYFVLNRVWKGGKNHPVTQTKKAAFARLLLDGTPVRQAAEELKLNMSTALNWASHVAANNPEIMKTLTCPCGKPIRHRGSCWHRMGKHGKQAANAGSGR